MQGIEFGTSEIDAELLSQIKIPNDYDRAQIFTVDFEGPDIFPSKTVTTFTKFSPITNEDLQILLPTAPFDGKPKFYVESLASNDKQWFYELISMYVNPGKTPEPFDVTTKVLTGDNTQLQSWEYEDCQIIDYTAFLDDVLVTRKFTKQFNSEIHDRTILECVGFSVNSGEQEKIYSNLPDAVPKYEDRAILYLYHVFGGEYEKVHSTGMISKFSNKDTISDEIDLLVSSSSLRNLITNDVSDSLKVENFGHIKFMGEPLPSKFSDTTYDTVERHINPSKQPEPFDIRVDVMTGDGTILYSGAYDECTGEKFAIYLNDGIASIKFYPSLKFEFRDRFQVDCVGVNALVMPQDDPRFTIGTNLSVIKPAAQQDIGATSDEVVCKEGMSLMFRPPTNSAICIFDEYVDKLENRGWITAENQPKQISPKLKPIIPTDQERAQRISVHFQGPDIAPPQQIDTSQNSLQLTLKTFHY